jgi:hypothetical protein
VQRVFCLKAQRFFVPFFQIAQHQIPAGIKFLIGFAIKFLIGFAIKFLIGFAIKLALPSNFPYLSLKLLLL